MYLNANAMAGLKKCLKMQECNNYQVSNSCLYFSELNILKFCHEKKFRP